MEDSQQQEGFLIRHWFEGNELHLVLEEISDDITFDLSAEIREITLKGVDAEPSLREGLRKSQGENLWITINISSVVITADFMPEQELQQVSMTVVRRPYKLDDVYALYAVTQSSLVNFRNAYGTLGKKSSEFQAKIANFIDSKQERLSAKRDFLKERDPIKAERLSGMLEILEELEKYLEMKKD
jgi:hypothetical protein